mmetsp:Transcript_78500/g.224957  ORF Transcript_78500/g.224957 Transcript_78500/m.224957 type:complete len:345 (+) Transcript_78500:924-1958(+)
MGRWPALATLEVRLSANKVRANFAQSSASCQPAILLMALGPLMCRRAFCSTLAILCASVASSCRNVLSTRLTFLPLRLVLEESSSGICTAPADLAARRQQIANALYNSCKISTPMFFLSPKRVKKTSKSSSSRNLPRTSSCLCLKRFCRFDIFCPLASASSKPEAANEVSKDLLFLPSFSPKSCWNIVSVSIKTMSSSLPAGSSFAPCDAFSASRCNFNAAVARSNCSVFAAALGSSASSSSSSSSSSPFLSSLSSSASRSPPPRTDAQRLERVSAGMKSPSSRQAARAASLTRPEPLTKSSAAMRGTTVRASEIAFCTLPDLFCFDCAFVEAATNFPKAVSNS